LLFHPHKGFQNPPYTSLIAFKTACYFSKKNKLYLKIFENIVEKLILELPYRAKAIKKEKRLNELRSELFSFQRRFYIFSKFTGSGGFLFTFQLHEK